MLYIEVIWQLIMTTPYINHNNYSSSLEVGTRQETQEKN